MIVYAVRRFINYLILTMIATVLGYILASIVLNPAARFYGRNPRPSDAAIEASLQKLGVDPNVPVLQRTWDWISGIFVHGTFGLENNLDPVGHDLLIRSLVSLQLLLIGSILGAILGVTLGVWGAVRQYQFSDQVVTYASYLVLATPVFVLGVLLMIAATQLQQLGRVAGHPVHRAVHTGDRRHLEPDSRPAQPPAAADDRADRARSRGVLPLPAQRDARRAQRRLHPHRAVEGPHPRLGDGPARRAGRADPDVDVLRLQLRHCSSPAPPSSSSSSAGTAWVSWR